MIEAIVNAFRAIASEPFVTATGAAAFLHSTWTLQMMFSGRILNLGAPFLEWAGANIPSALLAFAIDVGQIKTSADIRRGNANAGKFLTFAVLALATYYLQWIYMMHHAPALALGAGVRADLRETAAAMRDAAIFIIPALLPLSTLLYTMSNANAHALDLRKLFQRARMPDAKAERAQMRAIREVVRTQAALAPTGKSSGTFTDEYADAVRENADETYTGKCPYCVYETEPKASERAAKAALSAHKRHCDGALMQAIASPNGHNAAVMPQNAFGESGSISTPPTLRLSSAWLERMPELMNGPKHSEESNDHLRTRSPGRH